MKKDKMTAADWAYSVARSNQEKLVDETMAKAMIALDYMDNKLTEPQIEDVQDILHWAISEAVKQGVDCAFKAVRDAEKATGKEKQPDAAEPAN